MTSPVSDFSDRSLIYEIEGTVQVFKAFSPSREKYLCLKVQPMKSDKDFNAVLQEALVQSSLDHPNICQIYECFLQTKPDGEKEVTVVMELMETDLLTVIQDRRKRKNPWSEAELMDMFRTLIQTFRYIQLKVRHICRAFVIETSSPTTSS
jgi:serine/threonine protein kinase